ncbi:MAG TPA: 16S rRNA (guanine(527)-N(7))-methyltransferase RsmG [Candidatus Limnocylindrales bacterium]|nr:16S rRNA (guanine(527)-N(7))-methyltransferase RsmG [Candidatus Limnocylindrales bacterium]
MDRPREPLPTRVEDTPDLPPAYHLALDAGLSALGLTLAPDVREAIDGQARLLLAWTAAINLTAIRDPASVALAHVTDSLAAVPTLRELGVDRFIDLGSGGGYPGLPIAAALPAARALLLEPIRKKAAFLSTVVEATGLAATVEAAAVRAEALAADRQHRGRWPAVTARAIASLAELIELALPLLEPGGVLVAWKRGDLEIEWSAAERAMTALGGTALETRAVPVPGLRGHCLVLATAGPSAPAIYPRDPGLRRRRAW